MQTILKASQLRLKLKQLEQEAENASLFDRCEIEDEILKIKEQLGEFERSVQEGSDCENCSG